MELKDMVYEFTEETKGEGIVFAWGNNGYGPDRWLKRIEPSEKLLAEIKQRLPFWNIEETESEQHGNEYEGYTYADKKNVKPLDGFGEPVYGYVIKDGVFAGVLLQFKGRYTPRYCIIYFQGRSTGEYFETYSEERDGKTVYVRYYYKLQRALGTDLAQFEISGDGLYGYSRDEEEVLIPQNVTIIGKGAFQEKSLVYVAFPSQLSVIEDEAFRDCKNLERVELPPTIKSIGYAAFDGCKHLYELSLPEGLESIGECAFGQCSALREIVLPQTLKEVGYRAFYDCSSLKTIALPAQEEIGYATLRHCTSLHKVMLPKGIIALGPCVFEGCVSLKKIRLPESLRTIGDECFKNSGLESIVLPEGVEEVADGAFSYCENLREVHFGTNVSELGNGLFFSTPHCIAYAPTKEVYDLLCRESELPEERIVLE